MKSLIFRKKGENVKYQLIANPSDDKDPIKSLKTKCCVKVDKPITGL